MIPFSASFGVDVTCDEIFFAVLLPCWHAVCPPAWQDNWCQLVFQDFSNSTSSDESVIVLIAVPTSVSDAQGYIPGADGRCGCDPALSAGCLQCVVPGTCGPTRDHPLTGPVCQPGYGLITDPAAPDQPGQCVCVPSTAGPNCEACIVPGKCAACSGVLTLVDGVCSAFPCPPSSNHPEKFVATCPAILKFSNPCHAWIMQPGVCHVDQQDVHR